MTVLCIIFASNMFWQIQAGAGLDTNNMESASVDFRRLSTKNDSKSTADDHGGFIGFI